MNPFPGLPDRLLPNGSGEPGFDLPDFSLLHRVTFSELAKYNNIEMKSVPAAEDNWAFVPDDYRPPNLLRIRASAFTSNTILVFGVGARAFGQITLNCIGGTAIFSGADAGDGAYKLELNGTDTTFFLGKDSSSNGLSAHVVGQNSSIMIGEGFLGAHDVTILTSDMHALIDSESGDWLNSAESVLVGPHVWMADRVTVLKGSKVGFGSVLGYGCVLSSIIPSFSVAAGVPARVVKHNTTWLTPSRPDERSRHALAELRRRCHVDHQN